MEIFLVTLFLLPTHIACFFWGRATRWGEISRENRESEKMYLDAARMFRDAAEERLKASLAREERLQEGK